LPTDAVIAERQRDHVALAPQARHAHPAIVERVCRCSQKPTEVDTTVRPDPFEGTFGRDHDTHHPPAACVAAATTIRLARPTVGRRGRRVILDPRGLCARVRGPDLDRIAMFPETILRSYPHRAT
jgi:hypothetical protein